MENLTISSIGLEAELNSLKVSSIGLEAELNSLEVSSIGLEFEILEPPLFNDKTYTVYVGNTEIPNIYVGNNLLVDISFIIT
mgnify:CR=1 FL=1